MADPLSRSLRTFPSGPGAILRTMGGVSDDTDDGYGAFAARWLATVVAVFLRATRDPALAYDLATETLAAARIGWESAPAGDEAVAWMLNLGFDVLAAAVERRRVPSTERRRPNDPSPHQLTAAEQQEIMALADAHIDLPDTARAVSDTLARMAPPRHVLDDLRLSGLVERAALPQQQIRHG
jgi:hypothetical protein